jgi:pyruvate kinase
MTKIIVTLGPATNTLEKIQMIKSKGVDFVRTNMSHSSIDDLKFYIDLAKKADIPFIIDTEGSQVRTGSLKQDSIHYNENDKIKLYKKLIEGDSDGVSLRPWQILDQIQEGDILYIDFDTLVMRISDISTLKDGYISAVVISSGNLGKNKGVVIDPQMDRKFTLPTLTPKDIEAAKVGLAENIEHIAASFMRSGEAVNEVRKITEGKMKIISKVECKDALENLDDIIKESDYILIDRGDLSKEIPIEKIPFTQKIILQRSKKMDTGVYVATNLLESMITHRKPTRAEVHDIINTIVDGAYGLTLAAETAIGKYPIGCINMLNKIINHSDLVINAEEIRDKEEKFVNYLENNNYLFDDSTSSSLIPPHGGVLVNRFSNTHLAEEQLTSIVKIQLNNNQLLDAEQIAIGTYSPLEGFMDKAELESVLDHLKLPTGVIWPIPILLDIGLELSNNINEGDRIPFTNVSDEIVGFIDVSQKYTFDKSTLSNKFYGHDDDEHPGVNIINQLKPIFLGGKITIIKSRNSKYKDLELSPKQTRRLFEEKNWTKVVGFHTRNVIHSAHEYIQLSALQRGKCDGIFVHPVVGKKKSGDYNSKYIIQSYEIMQDQFYPENKTVFGVFSTYSRYGGVKEAIFTALCRKNYGCSHFIIGRDHTGVGQSSNSYNTTDIDKMFDDLGIEIIKFNTVYYSKSREKYIEERQNGEISNEQDKHYISGTEARELLRDFKQPPSWFMRPEISEMIIDSIKAEEKVFVI